MFSSGVPQERLIPSDAPPPNNKRNWIWSSSETSDWSDLRDLTTTWWQDLSADEDSNISLTGLQIKISLLIGVWMERSWWLSAAGKRESVSTSGSLITSCLSQRSARRLHGQSDISGPLFNLLILKQSERPVTSDPLKELNPKPPSARFHVSLFPPLSFFIWWETNQGFFSASGNKKPFSRWRLQKKTAVMDWRRLCSRPSDGLQCRRRRGGFHHGGFFKAQTLNGIGEKRCPGDAGGGGSPSLTCLLVFRVRKSHFWHRHSDLSVHRFINFLQRGVHSSATR